MVSPVKPDVRIFPDMETLGQAVAQSLADRIKAIAKGGGRFCLALAGSNTPRVLYRLLATKYRDEIPWGQVEFFWGDERYVPPTDSRSNFRMAREALLDHIPIPKENVHPMPTDFAEPEDAARAYEKTLQDFFPLPWPRFDLVLLGLGADSHTASLFPGSHVLEEKERWVLPVQGPAEPRLRLTLTLPVLNHAEHIYFLVAGAEKAEALRRVLVDAPDPKSHPASGVRLSHGTVVWWTDAAAARLFRDPSSPRSLNSGSLPARGKPD